MNPLFDAVRPTKKKRRRRFLAAGVVVAVAALLVYVFVFSRHGYLRKQELECENKRLTQELEKLNRENATLKRELKNLDNPAAVEKLAREELGLVKEGETVYRFVEKEKESAAPKDAPPPKKE